MFSAPYTVSHLMTKFYIALCPPIDRLFYNIHTVTGCTCFYYYKKGSRAHSICYALLQYDAKQRLISHLAYL